jgi:hypothetical protein
MVLEVEDAPILDESLAIAVDASWTVAGTEKDKSS